MCEICRQSPCASRCPNAPEPKAVYTCKDCKEGIMPGDEYVEIDRDYYHKECLEEKSMEELMKLVGYEVETAEEEEPDYEEYRYASGY